MDGTPEQSGEGLALTPMALANIMVRELVHEPEPLIPANVDDAELVVRTGELSANQVTLIKVAPYGAPIIKATGIAVAVVLIAAAIAFAVVTGR
jgi:hypothetical protein